jgi:hypothetical protein
MCSVIPHVRGGAYATWLAERVARPETLARVVTGNSSAASETRLVSGNEEEFRKIY